MRNAVFAAFYCNSPIYTNYHDPSMLDRDRNRNYRFMEKNAQIVHVQFVKQ